MVSASKPGPARDLSKGSSGVGACRTVVWAVASRPLGTNFGLRTRTTTSEAGRRSTVSVTSSPMRTKASVPFCFTSGGNSSTSTRGSFSGNGLRPVGLARVCAATGVSGGGGAGAGGATLRPSPSPSRRSSIDIVSCASPSERRSRLAPISPSSSFRHVSSVCRYSLRYSSRSAARPSTRALSSASLASMDAVPPSVTAMLVRKHAAIDPSSGYATLLLLRDAGQQPSQRGAVDVDRHRSIPGGRQLEHRTVEALVEQAQAISVEPEHLEPRRRPSGEHEQRPARNWVLANALARHLSETVEPVPHVDRLRAHEDPHSRRDHRVASSTRSKRPSASASNNCGTPTLRSPASRTSNRSSAHAATAGRTSTSFASAVAGSRPAAVLFNSRRHRYSVAAPVPMRLANPAALSPLASHRASSSGHACRFRLMHPTTTPPALPRQLRDSPNGYTTSSARTRATASAAA